MRSKKRNRRRKRSRRNSSTRPSGRSHNAARGHFGNGPLYGPRSVNGRFGARSNHQHVHFPPFFSPASSNSCTTSLGATRRAGTARTCTWKRSARCATTTSKASKCSTAISPCSTSSPAASPNSSPNTPTSFSTCSTKFFPSFSLFSPPGREARGSLGIPQLRRGPQGHPRPL